MHHLKVSITRFVDDHQPGVVECVFSDARGVSHTVIEKIPVITTEDLRSDSRYPRGGEIACTVLERFVDSRGEHVVRIDTELPWHVETVEGETVFEVPASLVK
jgi:hypothetical protein